jgi:PKD repeat protein
MMDMKRSGLVCAGLLIIALVLTTPVSGTIINNSTTASQLQILLNGSAEGDTIALDPGIYWYSNIMLSKDVTLQSNGGTAQDTIIDGNRGSQIGILYNGSTYFQSKTVTIRNLTFRNGFSSSSNGGGAINSYGNVTVISSDFFNDTAPGKYGGAISSHSGAMNITVMGSNFTGCSAAFGGAIANQQNTVFVNSSSFVNCYASASPGAIYSTNGGKVTFCRFSHVAASDGIIIKSNAEGSTIDATENWWGTNAPPAWWVSRGNLNPYLVLGVTATPSSITTAETSIVSANLSYDSNGNLPVGNILPDSIPVYFTTVSGPGSVPPGVVLTTSHLASTTFTPSDGGSAMVNASADGWNVSARISISSFPVIAFSGTPVSGNPPLTVTFNDTSAGTPAPSTWNWSFGDGQWFNTTDSAAKNTTHTYAAAGTYTVSLTANNTAGAGTLSRAGYITVTAPAPTGTPTPATPVATPDTRDNDDGFPSPAVSPTTSGDGTLPLMTVTVSIGGDSKAWQAIVTGTKLSDLIVTGTMQPGTGGNFTAPPGVIFQYISLVPARYTTITKAVINFTVPQAWLDENHIAPGSIVLYHQAANGWEALPATVLSTKDGTVYFSAQSTGFSLFAIAGTPTSLTPATVATTQGSMSAVVQTPAPAAALMKAPVTTQTTSPPATPAKPAAPSLLLNIVLVIAAIAIPASGGFIARRWWIRRQNPALFREYE